MLCLQRTGQFKYDESRRFARQSGSANNWAFGCVDSQPSKMIELNVSLPSYNEHAPSARDPICDIVRKEVELSFMLKMSFVLLDACQMESCDSFSGFNILLSLAGGTGSGVGETRFGE